jgi:hypothetical protein
VVFRGRESAFGDVATVDEKINFSACRRVPNEGVDVKINDQLGRGGYIKREQMRGTDAPNSPRLRHRPSVGQNPDELIITGWMPYVVSETPLLGNPG